MELLEAIEARRSVRSYAPRGVDRATIEQLLHAAVQAPTAMNSQPWVFGVIQDREALRGYSDRAKKHLLSLMQDASPLDRYRERLQDPQFNIFYDAPALVLIYARGGGHGGAGDCCLAAENLMLAACAQGLGTCWIGFSHPFFNLPEVKAELGAPADCEVVAPIIVGYPAGPVPPVQKNPPEVLFWR